MDGGGKAGVGMEEERVGRWPQEELEGLLLLSSGAKQVEEAEVTPTVLGLKLTFSLCELSSRSFRLT